MKVLLGCDVDPVLPSRLRQRPEIDIWRCLDNVSDFIRACRGQLPRITWLIRADDSVRFASGHFASGYLTRRELWHSLHDDGHELGWHMHLSSFDRRQDCFGFDPDPPWLSDAFHGLSQFFNIRATRTGWDYASNVLFRRFEDLGVTVDFSALPGNVNWQYAGSDKLRVDWLRCPSQCYHPSVDDYQRPGWMNLLQIPITQFANSARGIAKRMAWRVKNGCFALAGLANKTRLMTQAWPALPAAGGPIWSFYFHPEDLDSGGRNNFLRNLDSIRTLPDVEFVTASQARDFILRN